MLVLRRQSALVAGAGDQINVFTHPAVHHRETGTAVAPRPVRQLHQQQLADRWVVRSDQIAGQLPILLHDVQVEELSQPIGTHEYPQDADDGLHPQPLLTLPGERPGQPVKLSGRHCPTDHQRELFDRQLHGVIRQHCRF